VREYIKQVTICVAIVMFMIIMALMGKRKDVRDMFKSIHDSEQV